LCARSKARRAADSSCVGGRGGGGGADAGLTALTAASFCGFLTRVFTFATATFFAAALRANGFAAAFLVLVADFAFAADFFAALSLADLAGFRADAFAVTALLALGLEGDLALTGRFAVLSDADFALERDVDRLKPFVRLLLMVGNLKRLLTRGEQPC
jgi:hypothetical protein